MVACRAIGILSRFSAFRILRSRGEVIYAAILQGLLLC
uniref:Hydroxyacyl-CoA dehydrogenase trifunctional multienzyme complex subunit alpha n=1 Tax=Homo sapiens TaxID=9606 RepID=A0A2R8YDM1_HUMAN